MDLEIEFGWVGGVREGVMLVGGVRDVVMLGGWC